MALTATLAASIKALLTGTADMGTPQQDFIEAFSVALTNGTGADQANNVFADQRSIGAASSESLDLAGGLTNALGATLTFTAIKAIMIQALATNGGNITVGGAASNAFVGPFGDVSDTIVLGPGDMVMLTRRSAAGMAVTAGTGDLLKVANSDGADAGLYRIILIGEA